MIPEPVDLDIALEQAPRTLVVETEQGRAFVEVRGRSAKRSVKVYLAHGLAPELPGIPQERSLRQVVATLAGARPLQAFALPGVTIRSSYKPLATLLGFLPFILGAALTFTGMTRDDLGWWRFLVAAIGVGMFIVAGDAFTKSRRFRGWKAVPTLGASVTAAELELPPLAEEFDVDDVKEEYGRLLGDICYRIENPALFDTQEPISKAFTLALLQWDNNDGVVTLEERGALAQQVRDTFAAAKANAERIGMSHYPTEARGKAQTALKAAAVAGDTAAPEPEREAALHRAIAILDHLALYYLPTGADARKAITGRGPLALPGRRSS